MKRRPDDVATKPAAKAAAKPEKSEPPAPPELGDERPTQRFSPTAGVPLARPGVSRRTELPTVAERPGAKKSQRKP